MRRYKKEEEYSHHLWGNYLIYLRSQNINNKVIQQLADTWHWHTQYLSAKAKQILIYIY